MLSAEYNLLQEEVCNHEFKSPKYIQLAQKRAALFEQINIDINTGSFCPSVFEYIPTMLVDSYPSFEEITLEQLVSETDPKVSRINTIAVYSCLNG
jgi:hypothetical protein